MSVMIVAELSGNHLGSLSRAKDLIKAAAEAGADSVKIQTYRPDTITVKGDHPSLTLTDGPWKGRTLWDLYAEAATPWEWHAELFAYAKSLGLECFSTPFDTTAVDFLESLGCPRYKVSSFDVVNIPLLRRIAQTGKPVIMSTGMASDDELWEALRALDPYKVTLLHCVSEYPAPADSMNMGRLQHMEHRFPRVGLSDHSMTNTAAVCAVAMGASVIEKHICLSRKDGGPDSGFSLEPHEFKEMVQAVREAQAACSPPRVHLEPTNKRLRPSLWVLKDVQAGELVTAENVGVRRPGDGIAPEYWDRLIGRGFTKDVAASTPLHYEHLE